MNDPQRTTTRRPLRVVAYLDYYVPNQLGGSETAMHGVLAWLVQRGHSVHALVRQNRSRTVIDGVTRSWSTGHRRDAMLSEADVVISQHTAVPNAADLAARNGVPLVVYSHASHHVDHFRQVPGDVLWVWNSEAERGDWPKASVTCRPPVWSSDYRTTPGDHITLINLSDLKGGPVLWALAERHQDRQFLAVRGAWQVKGDRQIVPKLVPDNVAIQNTTRHIRDRVYARTRVLLMPSRMETYGRVGVEAAASGIPVIAHPTPGLREALGDDMVIWCDRDDLDAWSDALAHLDAPDVYARYSQAAADRARDCDHRSQDDLMALEEALYEHAGTRSDWTPAPDLRVVVVVPRRSDGGRRDELWGYVKRWWGEHFPAWPIIEGHHDDGPFNRSKAINDALRDREWDVVFITDGDSFVDDPRQVAEAVARAAGTGRISFAHNHFVGLKQRPSDAILAGEATPRFPTDRWWDDRNTASSALAVPRSLWDRVGGFDERFVGWGGEDVAFSLACNVLGGGEERVRGKVWHLWHPQAEHADFADRMNAYIAARDSDDPIGAMGALVSEAAAARLHAPSAATRA